MTADNGFNTSANSGYQQAFVGFWKTYLSRLIPLEGSEDGLSKWEVTAVAVCIVGYATEELYIHSLTDFILIATPLEFEARPFLQSSTYEDGIAAIAPEGVTVVDAKVTGGTLNGQNTINVDITLNIPLLFQVEEVNY